MRITPTVIADFVAGRLDESIARVVSATSARDADLARDILLARAVKHRVNQRLVRTHLEDGILYPFEHDRFAA